MANSIGVNSTGVNNLGIRTKLILGIILFIRIIIMATTTDTSMATTMVITMRTILDKAKTGLHTTKALNDPQEQQNITKGKIAQSVIVSKERT